MQRILFTQIAYHFIRSILLCVQFVCVKMKNRFLYIVFSCLNSMWAHYSTHLVELKRQICRTITTRKITSSILWIVIVTDCSNACWLTNAKTCHLLFQNCFVFFSSHFLLPLPVSLSFMHLLRCCFFLPRRNGESSMSLCAYVDRRNKKRNEIQPK